MASRIEDYALIGDCRSAGLIGKDGSLDWLCFPRFDSGACFAALLGTPEHGRWRIAPEGAVTRTTRRYAGSTLVLETEHETADGGVTVIDFMPLRGDAADVARIVVGRRGKVRMRCELTMRFDYGSIVPWVRHGEGGLQATAGPDTLRLLTPVPLKGENFQSIGDFTVSEGERIPFVLTWHPSYLGEPRAIDAEVALEQTARWWEHWAQSFKPPASGLDTPVVLFQIGIGVKKRHRIGMQFRGDVRPQYACQVQGVVDDGNGILINLSPGFRRGRCFQIQ